MWFIFTLITILFWGGADLFYKLGSDPKDKYSHWRIVIAVGAVMGIHAVIYMLTSGIRFDPMNLLRYLPVSSLYILSMTLGYAGLRYIDLSVSSPISNSSGAVAFLLCYIFLGEDMSALQFIAVGVICIGIFMLSLFEKRKENGSFSIGKDDEKYRIGVIAILFPILYCVIDGVGTFADALVLDHVMDEDQALLSYEFTFLIVALFALFHLLVVRRQKFELPKQKTRLAAGILEAVGQFFYVRAMADTALLAAPLIACYSIVSVLLSRLFLKEKLTKTQYVVIAFVMGSIAILGVE